MAVAEVVEVVVTSGSCGSWWWMLGVVVVLGYVKISFLKSVLNLQRG